MDEGVKFADLLAYTADEHGRWRKFFTEHPEALDVECDIAGAKTVRQLMFHVFVVNLFFAHQVNDLPLPDFQNLPQSTVEELFGIDQDGTGKMKSFLETASAEEWAKLKPLRFKDTNVSKRKMMTQAMLHGVHHRAQLATLLRQKGYQQDGPHDFILSRVME